MKFLILKYNKNIENCNFYNLVQNNYVGDIQIRRTHNQKRLFKFRNNMFTILSDNFLLFSTHEINIELGDSNLL